MNKIIILLIALLCILACAPPPTAKELAKKYKDKVGIYNELKRMIIQDTGDLECFTVGTDNIGDYWESSGKWAHRNDYQTKLELSEVLKAVNLTHERYNKYINLFNKSGAERIGYCPNSERWGNWCRIMIYRSGIAVSGCLGTIQYFQRNPPEPYGHREQREDFREITPLPDGWYVMVECN
ncbi:MAG: hypothetical protein JXB49_36575 [Bacteroidales bacterium]|nr:hypothetical protein [Bacteroidales bacterium]